ncbi:desulfoferrodoxin [uncultured Desulfuromusa sp.]|uniref:desulfoferrodoxin n=1 Tax=uncultured Desulfuromusa sp. TaxID=219183 RepID=UPI002AA6130A|nr:desulfoferrodoxin [uncultured Desulfuromusa sp.]
MPKRSEIYKCEICGNIVEVTHSGAGALICCGKNMVLMNENTTDAATEKHVPVIELTENSVTVKVGDVAHPMIAEHYIEWIEILVDDKVYRQYLQAGEPAEATFNISASSVTARAYCNLHGLWAAKA